MADRTWTKEQRDAINAESGTVLVAAAAGSGKTSVLVERIVRKLTDDPCPPEELLVVTFTNAAAGEMRRRIFKRIGQKTAEEPARRREFALLQSRLDGMKVCTMDAFCMAFARENFHACGVEPDFRILDQGEAYVLKQTVAAEVIERLYGEDGDAFLALSRLFERGRTDEALVSSVIRLSDFSLSEPYPALWLQGVAENFASPERSLEVFGSILAQDAAEGLAYCAALAEAALDDAAYDEALYAKYGPVLENDADALRALIDRFDALAWDDRIAALEGALAGMKAKTFRAPNGYADEPHKLAAAAKRGEIKKRLEACLNRLCATRAENEEDTAVLAPIARELIRTVLLFNETLLERKRAMNAYDFPDVLHFVLELLCDPAAEDGKTPLAREMSRGLREILIDEYQDTNRAQEALFTALSTDGSNMFMVGDVKQSIYRFRLASPELFIEKCDAWPYYDGDAKRSKIILGTNFRSREGVIDAVNFIFSSVMSRACGEIEYNEDEMLRYSPGRYPAEEAPAFEAHILCDPDRTGYEAEARYTAALIRRTLESGATVREDNGERPAVPGDFCILLRSAKGLSELFARALKDEGIPAAVDARGGFFEAAEIRVLLSLLRVIDDPSRGVDLLAVMLSPLFGFSADDAALVRIGGRRPGERPSLYASALTCAQAGDEKCAALLKTLSYYKKLAATQSVGELLRTLLADTGYLSVFGAMSGGEQRKNNVRLLLEYAEGGAAESTRTLGGFVRYMDALRDNGAGPDGAAKNAGPDSVAIMTMHRSKGLEFPFVIVAGTTKDTNKTDLRAPLLISHKNGVGFKRQEPENIKSYDTLSSAAIRTELERAAMSEELRVFYVALTRAREKLYLIVAPDKAEEKLADMERLLPAGDTVPACLVRHASAPYKWLLTALLRHPDAAVLRGERPRPSDTPPKALFRLVTAVPEAPGAAEEKTWPEPDADTVARIAARASFVYPFAPVAAALSKHTASSLKEEQFNPEFFARSVPAFLSSGALSAADRGTATHKFLQYCDFAVCKTSPESERERLASRGRLTRPEADSVDMAAVKAFVNSDLIRRCENALAVYREKEFTIAKSVCEMDPSIPEAFRDEKTVVIGKIDLAFVENDGAVIVDYKTDNVKEPDALRERYAGQLALYAEAFARITGIPVKERVIYSLRLRQSLRLE